MVTLRNLLQDEEQDQKAVDEMLAIADNDSDYTPSVVAKSPPAGDLSPVEGHDDVPAVGDHDGSSVLVPVNAESGDDPLAGVDVGSVPMDDVVMPPPPAAPSAVEPAEHPAEAPAPAEYPDDTPLAAFAPAPVRPAAAAVPEHRGPRAASQHALTWTDVRCVHCNAITGQFKYSPGPARHDEQDPPTWYMRVKKDGVWPSKGQNFRRRHVSVVGQSDRFCREWILENRHCCRGG